MQRNLGIFKDRADRDGELFAAIVALPSALTRMGVEVYQLAITIAREVLFKLASVTDHATVRAYNAIRPALLFQVFASCIFVLELRGK